MIVCPWPPGLPPPTTAAPAPPPLPDDVLGLLHMTTTERFHRAFSELRQMFARLGVPAVCAANEDSVPLILDRMDRLRLIGRRR